MNKRWFTILASLVIAGAMVVPVWAAPAPVQVIPREVVTVPGTANLWIADSQGVIHFASDPSVLADRPVDWSAQVAVTADQMPTMPIGEPWLTASFVKIGDAIFLPQVDAITHSDGLTFRRVASPEELALLGVTADNYGRLLLDQSTWEQRYGTSIQDGEFAGDLALMPAPPAAPEAIPAEETPPPATEATDSATTMTES